MRWCALISRASEDSDPGYGNEWSVGPKDGGMNVLIFFPPKKVSCPQASTQLAMNKSDHERRTTAGQVVTIKTRNDPPSNMLCPRWPHPRIRQFLHVGELDWRKKRILLAVENDVIGPGQIVTCFCSVSLSRSGSSCPSLLTPVAFRRG